MSRVRYVVDVDRIVVAGATVNGLSTNELPGLIERALAPHLLGASMPTGTSMQASIRLNLPAPPPGAPGLAGVIAAGVASAATKGAAHG